MKIPCGVSSPNFEAIKFCDPDPEICKEFISIER